MKSLLNVALAAATVGAISHVDNLEVELFSNIEATEHDIDTAETLVKTPVVRGVLNGNFSKLISNIHKEGVSLSDMYASSNPQTSGSNRLLMGSYSTGTQNNAGGSGRKVTTGLDSVASCHNQCHSDCHSNHSSRGWR